MRIVRSILAASGVIGSLIASAGVKEVLLPERYVQGDVNVRPVQAIDRASWIWSDGDGNIRVFRRRFSCGDETIRIHVSADNRYVLKLDGARIARGPERGTVGHWTYRTLDLELTSGDHVLEAIVQRLEPEEAPKAQLSWWKSPGFVLAAEGLFHERLSTGVANWRATAFDNVRMADERGGSFGIGGSNVISGCSPWYAQLPDDRFGPVKVVRGPVADTPYGLATSGWSLYPTSLPRQYERVIRPGRVRSVSASAAHDHVYRESEQSEQWPKAIPARSEVNVLWDLEDYYCAYPELQVTGGRGARVEFGWAESLVDAESGLKGDRGAFVGKRINCFNDVFLPDGGENGFTTTWWRSGRWVRLLVKTLDEPLTIRSLAISEVRYPSEFTARFECDDPSLCAVQRIAARTLQMCTHEMSFDCPFYEQQMYPGDTRIQLLVHNILSADDRLARRDMELLDESRRLDGLIGFNFPTTGVQHGGTYTFFWPMMLGDYALWHDNRDWLRARFPGLVHTMAGLRNFEGDDGLIGNLPGWNFQDWAEWKRSGAPGCAYDADGTNCLNNLLYVHALRSAADAAEAIGETDIAAHYRSRADRTVRAVVDRFWDEAAGVLADDLEHSSFSEHVLSLAILLDVVCGDRAQRLAKGLLENRDLVRTTVYFSHYLLEAYAKLGKGDLVLDRMDLWRGYEKKNLKTALEAPDVEGKCDSRSDCHAWSAHPIYHLHANILGLRPSSIGFRTIRIAPNPGKLKLIRSLTPTPKGDVSCDLRFENGDVVGSVVLPKGLTGEFVWGNDRLALSTGVNDIRHSRMEPKTIELNFHGVRPH